MELTKNKNIEYEEILKIVKKMSFKDKRRLTSEIVKELDSKDRKEKVNDIEVKEFQDFLLQGPVMSDEQYSEFKELRKEFSK